jgi:hypothetical protein
MQGTIGGIPQLAEANAENAELEENVLPELEQLLPGDLMQEIDQAPQVNLNLQVGFMTHQESRMIDLSLNHSPCHLWLLNLQLIFSGFGANFSHLWEIPKLKYQSLLTGLHSHL